MNIDKGLYRLALVLTAGMTLLLLALSIFARQPALAAATALSAGAGWGLGLSGVTVENRRVIFIATIVAMIVMTFCWLYTGWDVGMADHDAGVGVIFGAITVGLGLAAGIVCSLLFRATGFVAEGFRPPD